MTGERARWACTSCRERKIKCDANQPACGSCTKRGHSCIYLHSRRRAPTSRKSHRDVARRLEGVESSVVQLLAESPTTCPEVLYNMMRLDISEKKITLFQSHRFWISPCNIFAPGHLKCIDYLIGNEIFSKMTHSRMPQTSPAASFITGQPHSLPKSEALLECLEVFLKTLNKNYNLFEPYELVDIFQSYIRGGACSQTSWYAAINIVCAHSFWTIDGKPSEASERFFQNSLRILSAIMLEPPSAVTVGTLLTMAIYLLSTSRFSIAATILGSASQIMLLGGYHYLHILAPESSLQDTEKLQEKRLFWLGYILDQDLSIYFGKPSSFPRTLITGLPEDQPADGYKTISFEDGSTINCLREQVSLAKIQGKVYEKLRSPISFTISPEEFLASITELDEELRRWRNNLPIVLQPPNMPRKLNGSSLTTITALHCSYYRTFIAIHASLFYHGPFMDNLACRSQVMLVVAKCASAGRELVTLLGHQHGNPLSTIYLLSQIAWSLDGLFLYIISNRRRPKAKQDIQILKSVIDHFERYLTCKQGRLDYVAMKLIHDVACGTTV